MNQSNRLLAELRQSKPFPTKAQEAAVALLRTADVVRRRIAEVIEAHGITLQQYNVLRILRGTGPKGLPTLEIAERLVEQTPGITRLIDKLEKLGLLRRRRCTEDRRVVYGEILPAGLALLTTLDGPVRQSDERTIPLSDRELSVFLGLLDRIRDGDARRQDGKTAR